ncbi:MAG: Tn3 family transposase [Vulcanimicrobiaceae bacterium]
MTDRYASRLTILEDQEIEELYGRPQFTHDERVHFFSLTPQERRIVDRQNDLANRVLFILQAGYFKAKTMFFSFEFDDVRDDVRYIVQEHYLRFRDHELNAPILKQARHAQQRRILELYGYRACDGEERAILVGKAQQTARISAKPIFLFQTLAHHLDLRRVVVPGYSFLQDIVSGALATERTRLTAILERKLDRTTSAALDALYVKRDGLYAITPLKRDPKDFSSKEMEREIDRCRSLEALYRTAQTVLPELGISNDNIAYYAALIDYYTVQKLQQLSVGMVRLYLLCFLLQRYQRINDSLVEAFIYHVRKTSTAAKVCMQERVVALQSEGHEDVRHVSKILGLFLDERISDSTSFGEVKRRAFVILEREKMKRMAQFIGEQSFDTTAIEWDFIASLAPTFKLNLRPLLLQLPLTGHREDHALMEAIAFLKASFKKGKPLSGYRFDQLPKAFISYGMKAYLYEKDGAGRRRVHPDKYEFLVYRLLRNRLEAGDIFVDDSLRFRSFDRDLIPKGTWRQHRARILQAIDAPALTKPMRQLLAELEAELEAKYEAVNRRILSGENTHIKLTRKRGVPTWTLPYVSDEEDGVNDPFFDLLSQIHIASLLQFVDARCQCLEAFIHILTRYVKSTLDRQAIVACLIAYGTNIGLGKMGAISDLSYQTLFSAANNFIRLETLREANDRVSNAMAKLPIFRHYDIDNVVHSSSDGQKFETQIHTARSRHSPKYFGLKKGLTSYTAVANHVPINARIIGANEHESHYVFDVLFNNTTEIQPGIHSTDTHGANEVNYAILAFFGYQFAPRYRDIRDKMSTLHGFKPPGKYDGAFLLKPTSKINVARILAEEDNIKHILASLGQKAASQSVVIGKLSSYTRRNRTKRALWELDNIFRSLYLLDYVDSVTLRRNVQRALNRGESYHKLRRAVAYANAGRMRVRTNLEQQIWSECSRLLANCVIYSNASILSELLERKKSRNETEQVEQMKHVSPVSWRHVNFYGEYTFREAEADLDIRQIVDQVEADRDAKVSGTG